VTAKYNAMGAPSTLSSIITVESIVSVYIYTAALIGLALVVHFFQLGSSNLSCGGPRVAVTAAEAQEKNVNTNDATKGMKMAAVIPAGLPSMDSGSFGPSKLRVGGEDGAAGMHLELLCQRLAQLDKELDIRLSSSTERCSPTVGAAILSDRKETGEDISAAATPAQAPGPSNIPSAGEANSNTAPRLPPPVVKFPEGDQGRAQFESAARPDGERGPMLDATAPSLQLPVQQAHSAHPNLKSGPRHSIGGGEPASLNPAVVLHEEAESKVEGEQFMAPFQNLLSTVLCFAKDTSHPPDSDVKTYRG